MTSMDIEPGQASDETMAEIRQLAPKVPHRLAPYLVDGRRLTIPQAMMVIRHLRGCAAEMSARDVPEGTSEPVTWRVPPDDPSHEEEARKAMESMPGRHIPEPMAFFTMIPDGHYATPQSPGTKQLDFWHVLTKKRGKYAGRRYVDKLLGGHEDRQLDNLHCRLAMEAILAIGWQEAARLFSQAYKRCSGCPNSLTRYASTQIGLGRICAAKRGLEALWDEIEAQAPSGYYDGSEDVGE